MGVVAKSESKTALVLQVGSFWPEISVKDFKEKGRVTTIVDDVAALHFLQRAVIFFLDDVGNYANDMQLCGYQNLVEVESIKIGAQTRQEILYESAVFAYAKKLICDDYKDIDLTRRAGDDKAKELESSASAWHAEYLQSVRAFLGKSRSAVALI